MARALLPSTHWRVTPLRTVGLFVVLVGAMAALRLYWFRNDFVSLSYGVPLLLCIGYRSRRLLWSMAVAFTVIAMFKAAQMVPAGVDVVAGISVANAGLHLLNIVVVAATVHVILNLFEALEARNHDLEQSNHELQARDEEIGRQNEELQAQTEELAQQNEEIRHQADELQSQADALHATNLELGKRQQLLESMLRAIHDHDAGGSRRSTEDICRPLLDLFQGSATALAILEREPDRLRVTSSAGGDLARKEIPYERSFAAIAIEHQRTAGLSDLRLRSDLEVPRFGGQELRAMLAAPLRVEGRIVGTLEVYAEAPREWTREQFRILEWAAAQCSLMMETERLQERLLAANARLEHQVRERTSELQEMVNELEHFSYTITHDLRAPLRAMHGYAGILDENCGEQLDPENREYLRRIATAAGRMDRLITDALHYSKALRQELTMSLVDPVRLLRGMIESYPIFQPPRATIELAPELPPVLANEAGLTQCFSNLLENAVKFVPRDRVPQVRVRGEERNGRVRLWIEDNGIGIPPEMQTRVFVMFQRLSKEYDGTGIGLALVRKVVERMGGAVGVESDGSSGSRFWLELPAPPRPPAA